MIMIDAVGIVMGDDLRDILPTAVAEITLHNTLHTEEGVDTETGPHPLDIPLTQVPGGTGTDPHLLEIHHIVVHEDEAPTDPIDLGLELDLYPHMITDKLENIYHSISMAF